MSAFNVPLYRPGLPVVITSDKTKGRIKELIIIIDGQLITVRYKIELLHHHHHVMRVVDGRDVKPLWKIL